MGVPGLGRVRHCVPKEGETWGPVLSYLPWRRGDGHNGDSGKELQDPLAPDRALQLSPSL